MQIPTPILMLIWWASARANSGNENYENNRDHRDGDHRDHHHRDNRARDEVDADAPVRTGSISSSTGATENPLCARQARAASKNSQSDERPPLDLDLSLKHAGARPGA